MGGVVADSVDLEMVNRLALSAAFEPGNEPLGQSIAEHGVNEVVARLTATARSLPGSDRGVARWNSRDWLALARAEVKAATSTGTRFIWPGQPEWPTQLADLEERQPLILRVRGAGDLRRIAIRSVAIVGARAATRYGVWVAHEFSAALAAQGWNVVSGGAFGIDAAAHNGALVGGARTILVSAAGADISAPAAHDQLFQRCVESGVVVSEVPLGLHATRSRFLIRNRLIAALAPTTVVVEAAQRSGALATAREADALGRELAAVPGPITSAMSAGCHDLIKSGQARLLSVASDLSDWASSYEQAHRPPVDA